ncbi:hypothetical protein DAI22_06g203100 [Oryza sativa Japonica Group]|nr:hypothetical protein DAI22_06g203100 [Oryza sativa Japonica Group]
MLRLRTMRPARSRCGAGRPRPRTARPMTSKTRARRRGGVGAGRRRLVHTTGHSLHLVSSLPPPASLEREESRRPTAANPLYSLCRAQEMRAIAPRRCRTLATIPPSTSVGRTPAATNSIDDDRAASGIYRRLRRRGIRGLDAGDPLAHVEHHPRPSHSGQAA